MPQSLVLTGLALGFGLLATTAAAQPAKAPPPDIEAATRLQVFLDRAGFGPGKIDGRYGGFTQKALMLYREANGLGPAAAVPSPEKASGAQPANVPPATGAAGEKSTIPTPDEEMPDDGIATEDGDPPRPERTLPLPDLHDIDLAGVGDVFVEYQVTAADQNAVGTVPEKVAAMAEVKWLPYASLGEMVAEKYHCDLDFLKELNPGKVDKLKPGDTVKVPNVEPFDITAVKDLPLLDQLAMQREEAEEANDAEQAASEKGTAENKKRDKDRNTRGKDKETGLTSRKAGDAYQPAESNAAGGTAPAVPPAVPEPSQIAVQVNTKDNMLRLLENGRLVAAYPVTIGSEETKSPQGEWKVRGIARLPDFRYDSSFLKTGERGDKTYLLPPGPNNLVGVVWIALNRRGIGLHGTSEPDSIGRSASHGCVRLANWDVVRLATRVRAGVAVSIH